MAQFLCVGLYGPFTNLPFNCCAIYFDSREGTIQWPDSSMEVKHGNSWIYSTIYVSMEVDNYG